MNKNSRIKHQKEPLRINMVLCRKQLKMFYTTGHKSCIKFKNGFHLKISFEIFVYCFVDYTMVVVCNVPILYQWTCFVIEIFKIFSVYLTFRSCRSKTWSRSRLVTVCCINILHILLLLTLNYTSMTSSG